MYRMNSQYRRGSEHAGSKGFLRAARRATTLEFRTNSAGNEIRKCLMIHGLRMNAWESMRQKAALFKIRFSSSENSMRAEFSRQTSGRDNDAAPNDARRCPRGQ